jgi:hypothetical protein
MWYDKLIIKILLLIAKILSKYSNETYTQEIENLSNEMFKEESEEK